jgi:hypothetical protein
VLKHTSLPEGEALWIVPSRGVHTFGMKFAIDGLALDEAGVVIDLVAGMKPRRVRLPRKGTAGVLELPVPAVIPPAAARPPVTPGGAPPSPPPGPPPGTPAPVQPIVPPPVR